MMDVAFELLLKTCAPPTQCGVFVYIYIEDLTMKTVGYTRRKRNSELVMCVFTNLCPNVLETNGVVCIFVSRFDGTVSFLSSTVSEKCKLFVQVLRCRSVR